MYGNDRRADADLGHDKFLGHRHVAFFMASDLFGIPPLGASGVVSSVGSRVPRAADGRPRREPCGLLDSTVGRPGVQPGANRLVLSPRTGMEEDERESAPRRRLRLGALASRREAKRWVD